MGVQKIWENFVLRNDASPTTTKKQPRSYSIVMSRGASEQNLADPSGCVGDAERDRTSVPGGHPRTCASGESVEPRGLFEIAEDTLHVRPGAGRDPQLGRADDT